MNKEIRNEKIRRFLGWVLYWTIIILIYVGVSLVFDNFLLYIPLLVFAALNFFLQRFLGRPFHEIKHRILRRMLSFIISAIGIFIITVLVYVFVESSINLNRGYIDSMDFSDFISNSEIEYDRYSGVYTVRATEDEFRILQLTDIHIGGSFSTLKSDRQAFDACYRVIRAAKPDLIVVTGDIVYPIPLQTFSRDNLTPFGQFYQFMQNIGIPWAIVYGNHDTETIASYSEAAINNLFISYRQDKESCMLYAEWQPDIYGRYNQYLRLENKDGSLNRLIFLMDSNDYVSGKAVKEYDSIHEDQMEWYEEIIYLESTTKSDPVPSFVYMHIPFKEYALAHSAYNHGDPNVSLLLGENRETPNCPKNDSGFFELIHSIGSTQAVFVGHDHLNNAAYKYMGIDLVYGKSIDYIAYPGISKTNIQRGGTLVTVTKDGYEISHIDHRE